MMGTVTDQLVARFKEVRELELGAHHFYTAHIDRMDDPKIRAVVEAIAAEEARHVKIANELIALAIAASETDESFCETKNTGEIGEALRGTESPFALIAHGDLSSYYRATSSVIESSMRMGRKVLYLSLNKSADRIETALRDVGTLIGNVTFVDTSTTKDGRPLDIKDLVGVSIEVVKGLEDHQVVIVDALSTLSIYHPLDDIRRFVHNLISVVKDRDVDIAFIDLEPKGELSQDATIASLMDVVVKV